MSNRYFITGIGTDVGKTLVSAILTEALEADYWKPVQSGMKDGRDTDFVRKLVTNKKSVFHPEAYQLQEPLSPHFAAKKEAIEINMSSIQLPKTNNTILIEGAGGILVPLNDSNNVIELAKQFECEIVIVIRNYLGCINHSLLTLEYLENNGYNLKGLVLNGDFEEEVLEPILKVANTKVLLSIPDKMDVNKATIIHYSKQVNW